VLSLTLVVNEAASLSEPPLLRLARYEFAPTAAPIIVYEDAPTPDLLFMGSSRAAFGLDPAIAQDEVAARTGVHVRALNIAIVGGATDMNYLILKNIVEDSKRPKVIVYGLAEFELMRVPGYQPCNFPYFALLLRWDDGDVCDADASALDDRLAFVANQVAPLYRDRELIRTGLSLLLNPDDIFNELYTSGQGRITLRSDGFATWPPNYVVGERLQAATRAGILAYLNHFELDSDRVARFDEFLALAHARGIDVILVNMPVPPEFLGLWDDADTLDRFDSAVRGIARAYDVPLADMYANLGNGQVPPNAFIDLHHLTPQGAAIVTRLVADEYLAPEFR
jgi:hypothetical protein